ncbi:MAG: hypothetical protein L3J77_01470 [Thermoplasmata archaeon]|nr:hypothetical protein [Thermoplasmata archaeon]
MLGERPEEPSGRAETVGPAVEGEVHPGVRVPLRRHGREVRWVDHHPVEAPHAGQEVGPNDLDRQALSPRRLGEPPQCARVPVGRDDRPPGPGRRQAQRPVPAPDVEEASRAPLLREREEQERVLADRVDGPPEGIDRRSVWT